MKEHSSFITEELESNLKLIIESEITCALIARCTPKEQGKIASLKQGRGASVLSFSYNSDGVATAIVQLPHWLGVATSQDTIEARGQI